MARRSMDRRVLILLAGAALILSAALAGPVAASDRNRLAQLVDRLGSASDPAAAYAALSRADQAAVREFLTQVSVSDVSTIAIDTGTEGGITAAATTCWTWTWQRNGMNALGGTLWSYFQRIVWCGNGTTITSTPHGVQRTRWGEVYYPFWQWKHIGSQTWGGVGQQTYRAWTQGEFKLCLTGDIGCVQYSYPWLDMTAWANGRGTGSVGG